MRYSYLLLIIFLFEAAFSNAQQGYSVNEKKERDLIERRFIHPSSTYFSIAVGLGGSQSRINDPNNIFVSEALKMNRLYIPSINFEHGIKNNFFGEFSYDLISHGLIYDNFKNYIYEYGFFKNHYFNFGSGYRVINKNHFHFFNVHAGFFLGMANTSFRELPEVIHVDESVTNGITDYIATTSVTNFSRFTIGSYIGISKDIRLTSNVKLFLKYYYRFGFNSTVKGNIYFESPSRTFNEAATFKVGSTGSFYTMGLKFLIFEGLLNNK